MICKRQISILTSIMTAAVAPSYADTLLPASLYLPRQTISLQAGHGWEQSIDVLIPIGDNSRHMFFLNSSAAVANVYRGGDVGIGYRQLLPNNHTIYGASAFFGRYKTNYDHFFSQSNLNLEMLGSEWDARFNAYLPIGKKQQSQSTLDPANLYFQAHKLYGKQFVNSETIEPGAEIEIGRLIPGVNYGDSTLRAYVSYYHYGFHGDTEINGASVRAEYRLNHYITLTARESYDKIQGNELVFGISLSNGMPKIEAQSIEYRMTEYVTRRRIFTERDHYLQPFISPENFYFVNNSAAPGGDGTYERPYNTVQQAESDATNDGNRHFNYVYTYNGNGTPYDLGGQLNIGRKQLFVGSGTDLIYRGVNVLSASGTPTLIGGLNLSNNNYLSSFNLDGTGTGLNTGILGNNVRNITIQNINISNYTGNNGISGTDGQDGTDGTPGGDAPTNGTVGNSGSAGESAYGIHFTNSSNVLISNVNISNLAGGNGGAGGDGGDGGDGGNNTSNGADAGAGGNGGNGGSAVGIAIENTSNVTINNINITNLNGGNGALGGAGGQGGDALQGPFELPNAGGHGANGGNGGNAGDAIGVQFSGASSADINTATISGLTAGTAGDGNDGGNGGNAGGTLNPTPRDGGNGGNGGNGGDGGDAIGIQKNGATVSTSNITVNALVSSAGGTGGAFGTGGLGVNAGGTNNGANGSLGTTGNSGSTANTTP